MREGWRGMIEQPVPAARAGRDLRDPAPRRHDRRHLSDQPVQARRRRRQGPQGRLRAARRAGRDRRRGHARRRREALRRVRRYRSSGVPKTIDNDLSGTDYTFGFDTAVAICTEAIDRLHTTAESHNRVMVVEVMGRHAGLDRRDERHRGRRRRDPDPREARRPRPGLRRDPADGTRGARTSRSSSSARAASSRAPRTRARSTSSGTSCSRSAASASDWARRSRAAPGFETRVTVLGHVQRGGCPPRATAFSRRASG